jgi:tRNA G46 methylase TrmB
MTSQSKEVMPNYSGIHSKLVETVVKHRDNQYRKPIRDHNLRAFEKLMRVIEQAQCDLVLDSCCGTGLSSLHIAKANPNSLVIGIDQSEVRLKKNPAELDNLVLIRANCEDIWRLMVSHAIPVKKHFILYPNPWPKWAHLQRRWYGHPVFDVLPRLSNSLELRSNWKTYLDEFALAWQLITGILYPVERFSPQQVNWEPYGTEYLTLFEKKYHQSGQSLYRLICDKGNGRGLKAKSQD